MAAKKLRDDDARVVDMLLDSGSSSDGSGASSNMVFTHPHPEMFTQRFHGVERLLKVLDQMPASEPPTDLVARTLNFIDEATTTGRARPSGAAAPGAHTRPVA